MTTYLFDSDVVMDYFNKRSEAVSLVEQLANTNDLVISVLTLTEVISGWNKTKRATYLLRLQSIFESIVVTEAIAEQAGIYKNEYKAQGKALATVDSLIAATAIAHEYCLVTRNMKDYPMSEIKLYSWEAAKEKIGS